MIINQLRFIIILIVLDESATETSKLPKFEVEIIPRVVNGWSARLGDVPYQVAFKTLLSHNSNTYYTFCGGAILSPTKVLSAAHCFVADKSDCYRMFFKTGHVKKKDLKHKFAVAGTLYNRGHIPNSDSTSEGQWRKLQNVFYPSEYKFPKRDISIVITTAPFVYNKYVNYVPFATRYADYQGKCQVSGYGRITNVGTAKSDKLLIAHLQIVPYRSCSKQHRKNMQHFVCTSSMVTDVGKGDSGGPLVCMNTGDPNEKSHGVLVGIVSGHSPGVGSFFTRVSSYHRYIERNRSSTYDKISLLYVYVYLTFLIKSQFLPF